MTFKEILGYVSKYYKFRPLNFFKHLVCLYCSFLSVQITLLLASAITSQHLGGFGQYIKESRFILVNALIFDPKASLTAESDLNTDLVISLKKHFSPDEYDLVSLDNYSFVAFNREVDADHMSTFVEENRLSVYNSLKVRDSDTQEMVVFELTGTGNRFNLFSFQTQASAFILGSELSSKQGRVSRVIFLISLLFTIYLAWVFYQERASESLFLVISGRSDSLLKLLSIEAVVLNLFAYICAVVSALILFKEFLNSPVTMTDFWVSVGYSSPYLLFVAGLQILVLFNQILRNVY